MIYKLFCYSLINGRPNGCPLVFSGRGRKHAKRIKSMQNNTFYQQVVVMTEGLMYVCEKNETMEYIIYCDESVSDGKYYTDFFGGVLVKNADYDDIKNSLDSKKAELNLNGEIKWVKVTGNYLDKYKQMMDTFFSFFK